MLPADDDGSVSANVGWTEGDEAVFVNDLLDLPQPSSVAKNGSATK
jgi:hypothetical protein